LASAWAFLFHRQPKGVFYIKGGFAGMQMLALCPAEREGLVLATVVDALEAGLFQVGKAIALYADEVDNTTDWWVQEGELVPQEVPV